MPRRHHMPVACAYRDRKLNLTFEFEICGIEIVVMGIRSPHHDKSNMISL
jgi:hypothetical protein